MVVITNHDSNKRKPDRISNIVQLRVQISDHLLACFSNRSSDEAYLLKISTPLNGGDGERKTSPRSMNTISEKIYSNSTLENDVD